MLTDGEQSARQHERLDPRLGRGPAWRRDLRILLVMAGPNVATTIAQSLMSIVDYAIVSQLPEATEAQAAVNCGGMVFFTVFALLLGAMGCVATMVSQSFGARRYRDCSAYAWQGIWASVVFGLGAAALWPVISPLFGLFGHDPAVHEMETGYTRIRLLSVGLAGATVALSNYFNGIHRPGVNATSVIAANIVNAILSYGLVLGKWGLPAMGVEGAAWGSVIATGFRAAWFAWAMILGKSAVQYQPLHTWRYDREKMRRLIRIGWPAGAALTFDIGAWTVFMNAIVGKFGTIHMAASATVWRYIELSFMPAIGIGVAVCSVVGRAIGEGDPGHARRLARIGAILSAGYMSTMGVIYVGFGGWLMGLFSSDTLVIAVGAQLLVYAAVFQFFDAFAINYSSALRGAGDTMWPSVVAACLGWAIMVGGGFWVTSAHPELESRGAWMFAALFIISIGLALWLRWRYGPWEKLDVIGGRLPDGSALSVDREDGANGFEGLVDGGTACGLLSEQVDSVCQGSETGEDGGTGRFGTPAGSV